MNVPLEKSHKGPPYSQGKISTVVKRLAGSRKSTSSLTRKGPISIPSHEAIVQIIHQTRRILFPGYFSQIRLDPTNLEYCLGKETVELFENLSQQILMTTRHDCIQSNLPCPACIEFSQETSLKFIQSLPETKKLLNTDIQAALDGDPAAKSRDEIIFSYPGLLAISVYRLAHGLQELKVPLIPRIMTEYAHSLTGIDIHPGATVGECFFIDHGTGVVVGETTEIGNRVRLYQGVTLGALSLPRDAAERFRDKKRHPTIEDDVIIYSNATILGAEAVIGARSVIGGNVWLTESVPADTKVVLKRPELVYIGNNHQNLPQAERKDRHDGTLP